MHSHSVFNFTTAYNHISIAYSSDSGALKTKVLAHLPQYWRSLWAAMKTPAPHFSPGHSRRSRLIFPFSSTWNESENTHYSRINNKLLRINYLVVLENSELDFLVLMLVLLGSGVVLLLALLGTTTKAEHQVQGGFLLDVVVGQSATIFQLLASEDQPLLIRRNT